VNALPLVLWALVLGAGLWGALAKDWRASIPTIVLAVLAFVLLIAHVWR
jgi:uncharacterized membrane protein